MHFEPIDTYRLAVDENYTFGTDAVTLAHFGAPQKPNETVCDLGTGCGSIPFLLLSKPHPPKYICGVDIQPAAITLCNISKKDNHIENIQFVNADWHNPATIAPSGSFDRVLCNPPYFAAHSGKVSDNPARRIARTETADTLDSVCAAAKYLLKYGGHFCLCHRPERLTDILTALRAHSLEPKRLQTLQATVNTAPSLLLIDAVYGGKAGLTFLPPLILREQNIPTAQYTEIYANYQR